MFTDIKNSRNIIENNCTGSCNHAQSSGNNNNNNNKDKKMKKLWQPLKRLVTLQKVISFNKSNNNNNSAIASIPNNVYLNNAASTIVRPAEQEEHESPTMLDNKLPLDDRLGKTSEEEIIKSSPAPTKPDIFIHSASIEKTAMGACTNCVYGKNCQHFGLHSDNLSEELDIFLLSELPPPTDSQTQHLREWLKYNSWQMAKNLSY